MARKPKCTNGGDFHARLYEEARAELLINIEDGIEDPATDVHQAALSKSTAKYAQLVEDQIEKWRKHYHIAPHDPLENLIYFLAIDQVEKRATATKPMGATKWTYEESAKLIRAVDFVLKTNGGDLKKAIAVIQQLPEYKNITGLKTRYYEARKRERGTVLTRLMGHDPDKALRLEAQKSAIRRKRKRSTKIPT